MPQLAALPGLIPREALPTTLEAAASAARAQDQPLAAVTLDLDHFKPYQDRAGEAAATAVLNQLAELLLQQKPADASLVHLGADEFLLLLPATDLASAAALAETLRAAAESALKRSDENQPLTITAGVAASPAGKDWSARGLLTLADARMSFAKKRLLPHHNLVWAGTLPSDWHHRLDIAPGVWPSV